MREAKKMPKAGSVPALKPGPGPDLKPGPKLNRSRKAATQPEPRTSRVTGIAPREAYHHGALRAALIEASESLLAERGLQGFSLREVARRSGVTPAAPAHHFGDAAGLLDTVATSAFDGLTQALEAGNARGGSDPVARLREQGVGYVGFALRYPGRFGLMFRAGPHKSDDLRRSADAAFQTLENAMRDLYDVPPTDPLEPDQWNALLSTWSVVHGFAHLALAGQFDGFVPGGNPEALVRGTLAPMLEQHLANLAPEARVGSRAASRPMRRKK